MSKKITLVSGLIVLSLLVTVTAFAAETSTIERSGESYIVNKIKFSGVRGTVTALNGTNIAILAKNGVTYAIDASNAKISKGKTSLSFTDIRIGDYIAIRGIINGNNVSANAVNSLGNAAGTRITGTVRSFIGNILVITDTNGTDHAINVDKAKLVGKRGHKADLSAIQVNDKLIIFGIQLSGSANINATIIRDLSQVIKK